ncbi:MAG: cation transporter [Oscillospiraceae bacterium]|nr:cation transporter [Oscillospiraceae bacterium]
MTKLLLRLFVKEPDTPDGRARVGSLAGTVGILCNLLLFLGKVTAGLLSGSVAIAADGWNNLTDAASSIVTLLGFRFSRKPADAHHPFGHARAEYLSGLCVAVLILFIGTELARGSVDKILEPKSVEFTAVTFGVLAASIAVKLWMSLFVGKLSRLIDSKALAATSVDSRNDVIATSAVLLSCLVGHFFRLRIDGWTGLAVAVFILHSGYVIARETVSILLGEQADRELVEKLQSLVLRHEGILGIHDLLIHDYGPGRCFASAHVELSAEEDPLVCHEIIDHLECDALEELNVRLVIHFDPVAVNDAEWERLHSVVEQIVAEIDPQLSVHSFRLVRTQSVPRLVFDVSIPYGMTGQEPQLRDRITDALEQRGERCRTVVRFDGIG